MTPESRLEMFTIMLEWQHNTDDMLTTKAQAVPRFIALEQFLAQHPTSCVTVPELLLSKEKGDSRAQDDHVQNMSTRISIEINTINSLPETLLGNATLSFGELVDSRLLQFAKLLPTRTKPSTNAGAAKLLEGKSPVIFTRAESIFRTLPQAKAFMKFHGANRIVIIPFVFTVKIYIKILGVKTVQVRMTAPGTIVGTFSIDDQKLAQADVQIDVARLHKSMKMKCDQVVKKAYDTATHLTKNSAQNQVNQTLEDKNPKTRWWLQEEEPAFKPLQR
jgi:hypothetical protein